MPRVNVAILGLLNMFPMHGYQLNQLIREWRMDLWAQIPVSTLYRRLKQLEDGALVQASAQRKGSMPPRTVYGITPAGRERLGGLLVELIEGAVKPRGAFQLASLFIGLADPTRVEAALEGFVGRLEGLQEELAERRRNCQQVGAESAVLLLASAERHASIDLEQARGYLRMLGEEPVRFRNLYPQLPPGVEP